MPVKERNTDDDGRRKGEIYIIDAKVLIVQPPIFIQRFSSVAVAMPVIVYPSQNLSNLREFLLVKLINGEKATFQTPTFSKKRERTLEMLIKDLYEEYMHDSKLVSNTVRPSSSSSSPISIQLDD